MAFPTVPTSAPDWAATGSKTTPSAPKIAAGWAYGDVIPFDWLNWWQYTIAAWIVYLQGWLAVEHSATAGKHTKVTYATARAVVFDLANWAIGGWSVLAGTGVVSWASYPYAALGSVGSPPTYSCSLPALLHGPDDTVAGDHWVFKGFAALVSIANDSSDIVFSLVEYDQAAASSTVVHAWTVGHSSGAVTRKSGSVVTVNIDPAKFYFVTAYVAPVTNAWNARYYNLEANFERLKLE